MSSVLSLVPKRGFFPDYVRYASQLTDAPEAYHVAAALGIHSAICANYAEVAFPAQSPDGRLLYSWSPIHVWLLIVGPSGDRKSTALHLAYDVGKPMTDAQRAGIGSSPEGTFDFVSHIPDALFFFPEGAAMFTQFNAPYWQHALGLFCDLFDGKDIKRQLSGNRTKANPNPLPIEITITRPRVSLISGVATDHLDNTRKTDWTGGLIGRMILMYSEREKHMPISGLVDIVKQKQLNEWLTATRNALTGLNGKVMQVGIRQDAADAYAAWSKKIDMTVTKKPAKVRALFNRLPQHVLRVAANYALGQRYTEIDLSSMEPAIRFGEFSAASIDRIADVMSEDPVQRTAVKVLDLLRRAPQQTLRARDLIEQTRLSYMTLDPAVRSLVVAGQVKVLCEVSTGEKWVSARPNPS